MTPARPSWGSSPAPTRGVVLMLHRAPRGRAWPACFALVLLAMFAVSCTPRPSDAQRGGRGRGRERLREIAREVEQKRADGYDTAAAESLLIQLNAAMKSGDRGVARDLYDRI